MFPFAILIQNNRLCGTLIKVQIGKRLAVVNYERRSGRNYVYQTFVPPAPSHRGQIFLNGIDIRKYKYDDYINIFSVVFQDFQLLSLPLEKMLPALHAMTLNWQNPA